MFLRVFVIGGLSSYYIINVSKTIINHPFGNGLYHLLIVIWEMVYGIELPTLPINRGLS
jgi:hypothetical protein